MQCRELGAAVRVGRFQLLDLRLACCNRLPRKLAVHFELADSLMTVREGRFPLRTLLGRAFPEAGVVLRRLLPHGRDAVDEATFCLCGRGLESRQCGLDGLTPRDFLSKRCFERGLLLGKSIGGSLAFGCRLLQRGFEGCRGVRRRLREPRIRCCCSCRCHRHAA